MLFGGRVLGRWPSDWNEFLVSDDDELSAAALIAEAGDRLRDEIEADDGQWYLAPGDGTELMTRSKVDGSHALIRFVDGEWLPVHTCFTAETIENLEYYDGLRETFAEMADPPKLTFEHPVYRGSGIA